jgi:hypothetical protein
MNHLVADGFLIRDGDRYRLAATAAAFLDRNSPAYLGSAAKFIAATSTRASMNQR